MQPKKPYFAKIPPIAIFIVFAMSAPLGVLLFILKHIDKKSQEEEQAAASNRAEKADFRAQDTPPDAAGTSRPDAADASRPDPEYAYGHDKPTEEQKNAKSWHKMLATICTIMGIVFLFTGASDLMDVISSWFYLPDPGELFTALTMTIGGGGALFTGLRMDRAHKLEQLLDKIVGDKDSIPLSELFAAAGVSEAKGRPAVEKAISHGYFGADAYIDNRTDTLVVRGAAPQPPKAKTAPKPQSAAAPEDEYSSLLRQLREVNDAIPDPVMSQKITRLETVSGRIFALAEKDPGKKAQLQKFMKYYLPTALKLLNTYASLSAQDVEGENITEAKHSIEHSMDLLVTAFENQLDKLFQSDALDVSADIAALEGMLNLDGLTGSEFSK